MSLTALWSSTAFLILQRNTEVNQNEKEISFTWSNQNSVSSVKWFRNHVPSSILQSLNLQLLHLQQPYPCILIT